MPPTNSKPLLTVVLLCLLLLASPFSGLAQQDTTNIYRMAIPGKNWSLSIPKWALTEGSQSVQGDATSFNGAREGNKKLRLSPVIINIRIEPAKVPGDAQALSDFSKKNLRKKSVVVPESVKQTVYNSIPVIRYSIDINPTFSPQSASFPQGKIFEAYYVKDDMWITVHLSFLEFRKEDEQYFHSLLDALKIEDITK